MSGQRIHSRVHVGLQLTSRMRARASLSCLVYLAGDLYCTPATKADYMYVPTESHVDHMKHNMARSDWLQAAV